MPPRISGMRATHADASGHSGKAGRPGEGSRFKALKSKLAARPGVTNPGGLAAYIGKKKWGAGRMAKWSAAGRKGK